MRRVLAVAGTSVFLSLLVATRLPASWLIGVGLGCLFLAGLSLCFFSKGRRAYVPLVLFACFASLFYKFSYDALVLAPVQALSGKTYMVQAVVEEVDSGYSEEVASVHLRVKSVQGQEHLGAFLVEVHGMPWYEVNDWIQLELHFESIAGYDTTLWQYADGIYVSATRESEPVLLGRQPSVQGFFTVLRGTAAENIAYRLPQRLASVLSAVSLGYTQDLSAQTRQAFRMAGLSHVLVVSGMHLSIVCFSLNKSLFWLTKRKNLAVLGSLAGVLFFVTFTGFTPSMLRSGVACVLAFSAPFFSREADSFTSLGAAALFLCALSPYAAVDVGLQFSLLATLGVLLCYGWLTKWHRRRRIVLRSPYARLGFVLLGAVATPLFATALTLPVVIFNELSFSLLSVFSNLLVMPLLTPLVVGGFLLALPFGFAPLDFLLWPVALIEGLLLVFLERLTQWSLGLPWLYPSVGGLFAFVAVLVCLALLMLAARTKWKKIYRTAAALLVVVSLLFAQWQAAEVVTVSVAGTGTQASLVVSRAGEAMVFYRGRNSLYEIEQVFEREGVRTCTLWVDLRKTAQTSEAENLFAPKRLYIVAEDLFYREVLPGLAGTNVYLLRQEDGYFACVDVENFRVGVANGALNLEEYPPLDVLLAGEGAVQATTDYLLVTNEVPDFAAEGQAVLQNGGSATFLIRPGQSVVYKEASRDLFFSKMG